MKMAHRTTRLLVALLALAMPAVSVSPAYGQARGQAQAKPRKPVKETITGQARQDFMDGLALLSANDPQAAIFKFSRAYDASKEPRILYNIASCWQKLKRYVKAREFLRRYKDEAAAAGLLDEAARDEADAYLTTFDRIIGRIALDANVPGALVQIDDAEVGTTPLAGPIEIEEGAHRVRVTKPGHRDWSANVAVQGGGQETAVHAKLDVIRHEGRLQVQATPRDATIRVDGVVAGLGTLDRVISSGPHHVVVAAKGFRAREFDAVIVDDQARRFDVTLDAEPRSHLWAWVAGGVALVGGVAATTIILASQPPEPGRGVNTTGDRGTVSLPLGGVR